MYLVTGGAGFVGSHVVEALNHAGREDVIVVDDLTQPDKFLNLAGRQIADYLDAARFREQLAAGRPPAGISAILHQGACTNTMEHDGRFMLDNNFTFSKELLHFALERKIPFVYASSAALYGQNPVGREEPSVEQPLNVYAYSKLLFDQYVRRLPAEPERPVVGLRYFNVYGPNETFKGRMASMVWHLYCQIKREGVGRLFAGGEGVPDGGHRRDFVYVRDCARINLHFARSSVRRGIFNVGTGAARTFNAVGEALIKVLGRGRIEYIPFDEKLRGKYQAHTQADLTRLRAAGYAEPFRELEVGVAETVREWDARLL